jgi:hypothetical protein
MSRGATARAVVARKLISTPAMMDNTVLLKPDSTRKIDRAIDFFGETRTSAIRRTTWLTGDRHAKPCLPAVFLEHPLALDPRRALGA